MFELFLLHIFGVCVDWCGLSFVLKRTILEFLQYYFTLWVGNVDVRLSVPCRRLRRQEIIEIFVTVTIITSGAQTSGTRSPWRLDFVQWRLIFVGFRYGTWFMSSFWRIELLRWILDFWSFKVPLDCSSSWNTRFIKLNASFFLSFSLFILFFCNILGDFTFS
jgi:hypothetical protein